MSVQLNINKEPVCWANDVENGAPGSRSRFAYKWEKGTDGQFRRVPSRNSHGEHLMERIPQAAAIGTPIDGLRPAGIRSHVRVLRHDGVIADIRITQGAAHDPVAEGDESYKHYMLGMKGRKLGWIPVGACPGAMALAVDDRGREQLPPSAVLAKEQVLNGKPCLPGQVGVRNPPCSHFVAEWDARLAAAQFRMERDVEAFKTDEAKLLEANSRQQAANSDNLNKTLDKVAGVLEVMAAKVVDAPKSEPAKGEKK